MPATISMPVGRAAQLARENPERVNMRAHKRAFAQALSEEPLPAGFWTDVKNGVYAGGGLDPNDPNNPVHQLLYVDNLLKLIIWLGRVAQDEIDSPYFVAARLWGEISQFIRLHSDVEQLRKEITWEEGMAIYTGSFTQADMDRVFTRAMEIEAQGVAG